MKPHMVTHRGISITKLSKEYLSVKMTGLKVLQFGLKNLRVFIREFCQAVSPTTMLLREEWAKGAGKSSLRNTSRSIQ